MKDSEIRKEIVENNKYLWFVHHIKSHLKSDQEVICKICGKTVDECAEEEFDKIMKEINEHFSGRKEEPSE